jgi:predicted MPP superfamily phosphohydrolase
MNGLDILITIALSLPVALVAWVILIGLLKYSKLVRYRRYDLLHLQFDLMIFSYLACTVTLILGWGLVPDASLVADSYYPGWLVLGVLWFYALSGLLVAYGSFLEPWMLRVRRYRFSEASWPQPLTGPRAEPSGGESRHPVKIVLMSDFHASAYNRSDRFLSWVAAANREKADFIVLLGDYLEGRRLGEEELMSVRVLKELKAEQGVFAVAGNHDYDKHAPFEEGRQEIIEGLMAELAPEVHFLMNQEVEFDIRGRELRLVGLDDFWGGKQDASLALKRKSGLSLVATHNPDSVDNLTTMRDSLLVCGHTHGGQIRLPFLGQLIRQPDTKYGRKYGYGFFELVGNSRLLVTCGLGALGTRARLFCRPEIVVLEID